MAKVIIDSAHAQTLIRYLGLGDQRLPPTTLADALVAAGELQAALECQPNHEHQWTPLSAVVDLHSALTRLTHWATAVERVAYGMDEDQYRSSKLVSSCTAVLDAHAWLTQTQEGQLREHS